MKHIFSKLMVVGLLASAIPNVSFASGKQIVLPTNNESSVGGLIVKSLGVHALVAATSLAGLLTAHAVKKMSAFGRENLDFQRKIVRSNEAKYLLSLLESKSKTTLGYLREQITESDLERHEKRELKGFLSRLTGENPPAANQKQANQKSGLFDERQENQSPERNPVMEKKTLATLERENAGNFQNFEAGIKLALKNIVALDQPGWFTTGAKWIFGTGAALATSCVILGLKQKIGSR